LEIVNVMRIFEKSITKNTFHHDADIEQQQRYLDNMTKDFLNECNSRFKDIISTSEQNHIADVNGSIGNMLQSLEHLI